MLLGVPTAVRPLPTLVGEQKMVLTFPVTMITTFTEEVGRRLYGREYLANLRLIR